MCSPFLRPAPPKAEDAQLDIGKAERILQRVEIRKGLQGVDWDRNYKDYDIRSQYIPSVTYSANSLVDK